MLPSVQINWATNWAVQTNWRRTLCLYLAQCWPSSLTHKIITRLQWVNSSPWDLNKSGITPFIYIYIYIYICSNHTLTWAKHPFISSVNQLAKELIVMFKTNKSLDPWISVPVYNEAMFWWWFSKQKDCFKQEGASSLWLNCELQASTIRAFEHTQEMHCGFWVQSLDIFFSFVMPLSTHLPLVPNICISESG